MKTGYVIRDPASGLCWGQSGHWVKPGFAKIYPKIGRAKAAISYHRSHYGSGPMNRDIELVEMELVERSVHPLPDPASTGR